MTELLGFAVLFFGGGVAIGGVIFWDIARDRLLEELRAKWREGERDGSLWGVTFPPLSDSDTEAERYSNLDSSWGGR
jgi:hypothetical protein